MHRADASIGFSSQRYLQENKKPYILWRLESCVCKPNPVFLCSGLVFSLYHLQGSEEALAKEYLLDIAVCDANTLR